MSATGRVVHPWVSRISAWVLEQKDIRAAVLLGSHARDFEPADRWSDVDITMVADDPGCYLESSGWLAALGVPLASFVEPARPGPHQERRVLFADGQDVDFAVMGLEAAAERILNGLQAAVAQVYLRGYRFLKDELGLEAAVNDSLKHFKGPALPTAAEYASLINEFWYKAVWAAKKLRRGELIAANQAIACRMQPCLIKLTGYSAALEGREAWHGTRYFERWAPASVVAALNGIGGSGDRQGLAQGIRTTAAAFDQLDATCRRLLPSKPTDPDPAPLRAMVDHLLSSS